MSLSMKKKLTLKMTYLIKSTSHINNLGQVLAEPLVINLENKFREIILNYIWEYFRQKRKTKRQKQGGEKMGLLRRD